ncbi:hypothetical protein F1880_006105 [Penicillium rolfsii]|nr:hypothetical protein F1880_006105 [Penicillium rolfsii]
MSRNLQNPTPHGFEEFAAKWAKDIKAKYGTAEGVKFAVVGYSWAARFVCQQLPVEGTCKAGATAQPSFLKQSHIFKVNGRKRFKAQIFTNMGHGFAHWLSSHGTVSLIRTRSGQKEQSCKSYTEWLDFWLPKM